MATQGYREEELVKNRAAVLLIGGNDGERRAWAEEAATFFPDEGEVREVSEPVQLGQALARDRGIVFVPDVAKLGYEGQAQVLRCLQYQEERPKLVLGLGMDPTQARSQGALREDLHYRLHLALVNLATPGLKDTMRTRRQKAEAIRKEQAARLAAQQKKEAMKKGGARPVFRPAIAPRPPVVQAKPVSSAPPAKSAAPPVQAAAKPSALKSTSSPAARAGAKSTPARARTQVASKSASAKKVTPAAAKHRPAAVAKKGAAKKAKRK